MHSDPEYEIISVHSIFFFSSTGPASSAISANPRKMEERGSFTTLFAENSVTLAARAILSGEDPAPDISPRPRYAAKRLARGRPPSAGKVDKHRILRRHRADNEG